MDKDTAGMLERRQRPRVRSEWPVKLTTTETRVEGVVENISPLGALISATELPTLSEKFRLVIEPPNRQALKVIGEAVWRAPLTSSDDEPRDGSGVKFVHISESDSRFLHDVMTSFYLINE